MKFTKALLAAALISGVAGTASATTYTFNNNGTSFTIGGLQLTVTTPTGTVNNASSGLGVKRSTLEDTSMNSDAINEGKDILIFTFNKAVKLTNMTMTAWQNGNLLDQADLTYNNVITRLPNTGPNFTFNPVYYPGIYVTSFKVTAKGSGTAFRISSLNVTEVPVPAAAWLMGSGLLGLAGVARRRRS
jgi:hypothetical protein